MKPSELNRRDFTRLTVAAFGGMLAGAGCSKTAPDDTALPAPSESSPELNASAPDADTPAASTDTEPSTVYLTQEPHVCRGLNTCKGKGLGGDNDCAGQGTCHTANKHDCHYANDCKGQGGCGEIPGQNACKGQGHCAVPLGQPTWERARKAFEEAMKTAGKEVGAAPAAS